MQIAQIEADKYGVFNSITDARKKNAQINAVKYIKTLAVMSSTNIMHWNILELFSKDGQLLTDRTSINKVFFSYRDIAPTNPTNIIEQHYAKLLALTSSRQRYSCANLKDQAERKQRQAVDYYNSYYLPYLKEAAGLTRRYHTMMGYTPNYALEIEQLIAAGFYSLSDVTESEIVMDTVNDIVLVHINSKHGVKRSVNLGRFRVRYDLLCAAVYVETCGGNIMSGGYYHPHLSSNRICFGELQNEAHDMIAAGNLTATMEIVQKALTCYNEDSPYRQLEYFEAIRKSSDNNANSDREDEDDGLEESRITNDDTSWLNGSDSPPGDNETVHVVTITGGTDVNSI